jgi:hypothetical protein
VKLIDGRYLKHEICAFSGDWLIVYDGRYNYMLFSTAPNAVLARYKQGRLPSNNICSGAKYTEFYSTFDNACDNLMRVVVNDGFKPTFLKDVFV